MIKRLISICFCVLMLVPFCMVKAEAVSAQFACVMEAQTGQVLYEKNAYSTHSMASTTKIMTALIALEQGNLTDTVTVGENAAGTEGTSLYLKVGDKISLLDLLYGLILQSGNDAAIAIAEHIGGSVEKFASLMTEKAKALGAENTAFKNPNGLDEEGHYTTAYDLALITRAALRNEKFAEICATKSKTIQDGKQTVVNHNKLLNMYDGCVGVKTGYTKKTGRCLVSSAVRDGKQLICVTLNAPDDWNDHTVLLNEAFDRLVRFPLLAEGMTVNTISVQKSKTSKLEVLASRDFYLTERADTKFQNADMKLKLPDFVTAPVKKGEILGVAEIYYQGTLLDVVDLIAKENVAYYEVPKKELFQRYFKKMLFCGCKAG